jgi:hypothetical protein
MRAKAQTSCSKRVVQKELFKKKCSKRAAQKELLRPAIGGGASSRAVTSALSMPSVIRAP